LGTVHRHARSDDGRPSWTGVASAPYDANPGAVRQILIGANEGAAHFSLRYFEIPEGGASSLDLHAHDHGVYILTGTAELLLGTDTHNVGPGDVIYIEPNEQHQFRVTGAEPFGFLCVAPPRA